MPLPGAGIIISIHALREEGDFSIDKVLRTKIEFLSTPSARRATKNFLKIFNSLTDFYPRPPRGGRPPCAIQRKCFKQNFYPRPPRGGRPPELDNACAYVLFLSTPSARRATHEGGEHHQQKKFLSTPSARRATPRYAARIAGSAKFLSTPSARRATALALDGREILHISIHALREEGDVPHFGLMNPVKNFYPRPPRGGRLPAVQGSRCVRPISIHALREEGDDIIRDAIVYYSEFLSTPSARRATRPSGRRGAPDEISIHALREEGDQEIYAQGTAVDISIHALREEGDKSAINGTRHTYRFLSTPSARRATQDSGISGSKKIKFLSTPSARRATRKRHWTVGTDSDFYPRPPRGGRRIDFLCRLAP